MQGPLGGSEAFDGAAASAESAPANRIKRVAHRVSTWRERLPLTLSVALWAGTGVFAGNDPMAIGAFYACREAGLSVPGDVSIVGAGNIEGAHHPNPFVTTVDWPRSELGRTAATMLLAAINDPRHYTPQVKVFEPRLLVRQSTAPPACRSNPAPKPRTG